MKDKVDFCSAGIWEIKNGQVISRLKQGSVVDCREGSEQYGKVVSNSESKEAK